MAEYTSLGYDIAKVHKVLRARLQGVLDPHGLTVPQFEVMRTLLAESGLTAAQLVERIVSDSSTVMAILKRLEQRELVIRRPDKNDGRIKRIYLTEGGEALTTEVLGIVLRYNRELDGTCSDEERRVFDRVISKLHAFCRSGQKGDTA